MQIVSTHFINKLINLLKESSHFKNMILQQTFIIYKMAQNFLKISIWSLAETEVTINFQIIQYDILECY